jgi:hypothetical protein
MTLAPGELVGVVVTSVGFFVTNSVVRKNNAALKNVRFHHGQPLAYRMSLGPSFQL